MASPFRIINPTIVPVKQAAMADRGEVTATGAENRETTARVVEAAPEAGKDTVSSYLERLMKMIPAEVVSLYLVGSGVIPDDEYRPLALTIWTVLCFIGVICFRIWGTRDRDNNLPADRMHVAISTVAFVIWIYTIGGPFKEFRVHIPYIGSLAVLAWTFFVPIFYKGPKDVVYAS